MDDDQMAGEMQSMREMLNESCKGCNKLKQDADEIAPVLHGKYSVGPDWYCGDCLPD